MLTEYTLDPIIAFIVFPAGRRPSTKGAKSSPTISSKQWSTILY